MSEVVSPKKEKILIIDDDKLAGRVADMLRNTGYTVFMVKTVVEGLKNIFDVLPHLVILDLAVSGGDAYEILEKKMAEPLVAKIPVFLMSTQVMPINMRRVPENSVTEFIVSLESDPSDIVRLVNRQFGYVIEETKKTDNNTAGGSSSPKKKIFWVEDDKLIGSILEKKYLASGFKLIHVKNGEEALMELAQVVPNVIILDLLLPGMSGFDILQKIRSMKGPIEKVPVMILSNLSKPSDIERAKILGAARFMVKAASSLDQIISEVRTLAA